MSHRAVPSSTTQPMFRDGDSNVETWTTLIGAAAEVVVLVAAVVVAAGVLLELDCAVTVTIFSVTVFVPLDPQPARATASATPANAPIALVTIDSLYRARPTGRFNT